MLADKMRMPVYPPPLRDAMSPLVGYEVTKATHGPRVPRVHSLLLAVELWLMHGTGTNVLLAFCRCGDREFSCRLYVTYEVEDYVSYVTMRWGDWAEVLPHSGEVRRDAA